MCLALKIADLDQTQVEEDEVFAVLDRFLLRGYTMGQQKGYCTIKSNDEAWLRCKEREIERIVRVARMLAEGK